MRRASPWATGGSRGCCTGPGSWAARLDGWTDQFRYDLWLQAFEDCGLDIAFYAHRERALDELLPWDHIDAGIDKAFLKREYERAMRAQTTRDCREGCNGCGLQKLKGVCRACE